MKIYIGIDPGLNGGMSVIGEDSNIIELIPYDLFEYNRLMEEFFDDDVICCIEKVGAMPNQGVSSTFTFGKNYGQILGLLTAHHIPYQEISPMKWKKEFNVNSDKKTSIEKAKQLFPDVDLHKTTRCRTDHDGMAEALLMSLYARRKL